jgi:hypothetical protein
MVHRFRQSSIVSSCSQYATCNESHSRFLFFCVSHHILTRIVLADPCGIIESKFGIQHGRFVAWNPAVGQGCLGIYDGYDYCVSTPNSKPTYTAFPHTCGQQRHSKSQQAGQLSQLPLLQKPRYLYLPLSIVWRSMSLLYPRCQATVARTSPSWRC